MNEYPSYPSRILCFIISLILHLLLLLLLWITWPELVEVGSGDQQTSSPEAAVIQPYAGTSNPAIVFFQPPQPTPAHAVPQAPMQTSIVASTDDYADATQETTAAADDTSQRADAPHEDSATALPLRQAESAPYYAAPQQQKKARRKKKKQQAPGVSGLSFASLLNKKAAMPPTSPMLGGSSSSENFARDAYATRVQNFISRTINIEGVQLLLSRTFIQSVVFQTSINRDGKVVDFHMEPCDTPELKLIEEEVRKVIMSAGLFPTIPRSISNDCCTIPFPLRIIGELGGGNYKIMQK